MKKKVLNGRNAAPKYVLESAARGGLSPAPLSSVTPLLYGTEFIPTETAKQPPFAYLRSRIRWCDGSSQRDECNPNHKLSG